MIIRSIELENIRSYKKDKIYFEEGINFLSGDIGSGKSSILQAIEFALFGFKRGDLEAYQLLRKGESVASVTLILESEANINVSNQNNQKEIVEIHRKIKKAKNSSSISQENGYLKINDNIENLSPAELNSHIFEYFDFPKEFLSKDKNLIYRFTIYTPQEQLKEILFSDIEKRLELIRKIFDIDKYKQLKNAISIFILSQKEKKIKLSSKFDNISFLEDEIKLIKLDLNEIRKNLTLNLNIEKKTLDKKEKYSIAFEKREVILEKYRLKIGDLEKKLVRIDEIKKNLEVLMNEKRNKQKQVLNLKNEELDKNILKLNKIIEKQEKDQIKFRDEKKVLKNKLERFNEIKEEKIIIEKNLSDYNYKKNLINDKKKGIDLVLRKCKIRDLENKFDSLLQKKLKLEKKLKEEEKIKTEILKIEINLDNKKKEEEDSILKLKNISKLDSCPTCLQNVCDDHKQLVSKNIWDNIDNEKNLFLKSKFKLDELNEKLSILKILVRDFDKYNKTLISTQELIKIQTGEKEKEILLINNLKKDEDDLILNPNFNLKELNFNLKNLNEKLKSEVNLKNSYDILLKDELILLDEISKNNLLINKNQNNAKELVNINKDISIIDDKISRSNVLIVKRGEIELIKDNLKDKESSIKKDKLKLRLILDKLFLEEKNSSANIKSYNTQILDKTKLCNDKEILLKDLFLIKKDLELLLIKEEFLSKTVVDISQIIERYVFTKYYVEFSEEFERVFKELIEDNDIEVRLDEDFSPIIEQNGYDIDIRNLSGGEKSSIALAYRFGLKKIIEDNITSEQKLSLLILDEPSDGFSENQVMRMGELLKTSTIKQIILVSHDEKVESISDIILNVEKINHESKVS